MRRPKRNSPWWAYLDRLGKLDAQGEELAGLKSAYRREYMRSYKRDERKRNTHFTVTCKSAAEESAIRKAAKEHHLTTNAFLKTAVFGYMNTVFVQKDRAVLDRIFQAMLRCQTAIQQIKDRDKGGWFRGDRDYEGLAKVIAAIQGEIAEAFSRPPKLEDEIEAALKASPQFIDALKRIIDEHSKVIHEKE